MPKNQNTAAKRARAAVRTTGEKFTTALRADQGSAPASAEWDEVMVEALSAVVATHLVVPVREIWDASVRTSMVQQDDGVRWGVAEPAADGVVVREVENCTGAVPKGTRIPVPHRLADGQVEVAALWPVVWCSSRQPFWRYVHNGWSVERPGTFPYGFDPLCPSPELPYEVRTYTVPDGILGEDHLGGAPVWSTAGWCDRGDKAVLLADALVAHHLRRPERPASGDSGTVRAEVWQHSTTDLSTLPYRVHAVDAAPDRQVVPHLPFNTPTPGRPASAGPAPEPVWFMGAKYPPTYHLRVWNRTDGWTTLAWIPGGRNPASIAAVMLRVGTGGQYEFAETWGPRHELMDLHPDEPYVDRFSTEP
jgi:hypothetical protein